MLSKGQSAFFLVCLIAAGVFSYLASLRDSCKWCDQKHVAPEELLPGVLHHAGVCAGYGTQQGNLQQKDIMHVLPANQIQSQVEGECFAPHLSH